MKQLLHRSVGVALFSVMGACRASDAPSVVPTVADSLQGTWRVAPFPTPPDSDLARSPSPFGRAPVGYLVYDATGHVFWQVMRRSAMDSLIVARRRQMPDSIVFRLSKGFSAQFGTYSVDAEKRTVTHHYEGELLPWGGSFEVATPFRLNGDSLFIGVSAWQFVRVKR